MKQQWVEDALQSIEARDAVFFDPSTKKYDTSMKEHTSIYTNIGEVFFEHLREDDGIVICAHRCGKMFISGLRLRKDSTGYIYEYVKTASMDPVTPKEGSDCALVDPDNKLHVSEVDLRGAFLEPKDLMRLSRGLCGNYFLSVLSLSGNHIQDDGATAIADALAQNAWLMELNLSYNDIGLYGSTMLATSLARHKLIRKLDLSHNLIGSQGIYPWLGKTLRTNQSLIELRLSHNKIGDEKVCDVLAALAPTQLTEEEKIKQLMAKRQQENQRRNTIELSTLRKEEPYNKTLSTLLLDDTGISDQAAEYLSIALRENHAITHLDISSNRFGKEGNTKIAEGLEANSSLTLLNYNNVKMDEESAKVVVQALVGHRHLTKLAFQNSLHGSPTAHALGDVIRSSKTLKNIDLSHCRLEAPGVVHLFRSFAENSSVENVEMMDVGLKSDNAVGHFAQALQQNRALRMLNLSYNGITIRGCKALKDSIAASMSSRDYPCILNLEGNSGEKKAVGVIMSGGQL